MSLTENERLASLRLARTEGVGPVAFRELTRRYGSAQRALDALPRRAAAAGRVQPLSTPTIAQAQDEVADGLRLGAELVFVGEAAYPPLLAAVDPPPPLLWVRGDAAILHKPMVALVGARVASAAGQRFARALAAELGQAGFAVVSGMARGVDGAAHEGALPTGTAAVLGGGVDDVYPPEHAALYARLVAEGCVVSESAPGRRAQARDFPRRNRIISGLSLAVVVVEAELRSGSLITARIAGEHGREVLAVPGSPLDPRSKGTNDLIRQGAAICESAEDVIRVVRPMLATREQGDLFAGRPLDADAVEAAADRLMARVAALLSPAPVPIDEIVRAVGEPAPGVLAALVELSLAGRAELLSGGRVAAG